MAAFGDDVIFSLANVELTQSGKTVNIAQQYFDDNFSIYGYCFGSYSSSLYRSGDYIIGNASGSNVASAGVFLRFSAISCTPTTKVNLVCDTVSNPQFTTENGKASVTQRTESLTIDGVTSDYLICEFAVNAEARLKNGSLKTKYVIFKETAPIRTLTFEVDGQTYATIKQVEGTEVTAPANPSKTGYTFTGWNPSVPSTMPSSDTTYTAQFTVNQYTLTFVSDGQTYTTITQDYGTAVTAPSDPTKTGYEFTGWSPSVPSTMPSSDMTLTAQFSSNQYTLTFISEGETYTTITQDYGTAVTAPANPSKTGYEFTGWSPSVPSTMPAENKTFTAQFSINQYTLTFISDGETYTTITQDYGTSITAPSDPSKTGYTFNGWSPSVPSTMPAENKTFTAQFSQAAYTFTYYVNGQVYATQTYSYGDTVTAPADPTYEDFRFLGWNPEIPATATQSMNFTAEFNDYVIIDSSADLPVFREKLVNSSDGDIRPGNIIVPTLSSTVEYKEHEYVQRVLVNGIPSKYCIKVAERPTMADVDVSMPILYDGSLYNVTWLYERDSQGKIMDISTEFTGTADEHLTMGGAVYDDTYNDWYDEIGKPADPSIYGNRLIITSDEYTLDTSNDVPVLDDNDIPVWIHHYEFTGGYNSEVDFTDLEMTSMKVYTQVSGSDTLTEVTLTKTDAPYAYTFYPTACNTTTRKSVAYKFWEAFTQWYDSSTYEIIKSQTYADRYIAIIFAEQHSNDEVTVYVYDDAALYSAVSGLPGDAFEPETPMKDGSVFVSYDPEITVFPQSDTNVSIIWTDASTDDDDSSIVDTSIHTLSYYVQDDLYATAQVREGNDTSGLVKDPIVKDYVFTGWSNLPQTMPASDVSVSASLSSTDTSVKTLTYMVDGSVYKSYTIYPSNPVPIEPYPARSFKNFSGWSGISPSMPAQNLVVTGTFGDSQDSSAYVPDTTPPYDPDTPDPQSSYTLKYYLDGTLYRSVTVNVNATITPITPPEKSGYDFTGWIGLPANNVMPARNVTVYGTYRLIGSFGDYKLTYYVNSKQVHLDFYDQGDLITPYTYPYAAADFSGWHGLPTYMPGYDVDVYATQHSEIDEPDYDMWTYDYDDEHYMFNITGFNLTYIRGRYLAWDLSGCPNQPGADSSNNAYFWTKSQKYFPKVIIPYNLVRNGKTYTVNDVYLDDMSDFYVATYYINRGFSTHYLYIPPCNTLTVACNIKVEDLYINCKRIKAGVSGYVYTKTAPVFGSNMNGTSSLFRTNLNGNLVFTVWNEMYFNISDEIDRTTQTRIVTQNDNTTITLPKYFKGPAGTNRHNYIFYGNGYINIIVDQFICGSNVSVDFGPYDRVVINFIDSGDAKNSGFKPVYFSNGAYASGYVKHLYLKGHTTLFYSNFLRTTTLMTITITDMTTPPDALRRSNDTADGAYESGVTRYNDDAYPEGFSINEHFPNNYTKSNVILFVPAGSYSAYRAHPVWGLIEDIRELS